MVKNVLKDGTVLKDITGHVVKVEEADVVYAILDKINERCRKERKRDQ